MNSLTTKAPSRVASIPISHIRLAVRGAVGMTGLRTPMLAMHRHQLVNKRSISSTGKKQIKEFFPPQPHDNIKEMETAWPHPV